MESKPQAKRMPKRQEETRSKRQEETRSRRQKKTQIGLKRGNLYTWARKRRAQILAEIAKVIEAIEKRNKSAARRKRAALQTSRDAQASGARSAVYSSGRDETGHRRYGQARGRVLDEILAVIAKVKEAIEDRNASADKRKRAAMEMSLDLQASEKARYDQTKKDLEAASDRQARESQVTQFLGEEINKLKAKYAQMDKDLKDTREALNSESQVKAQQLDEIFRLRAISENQHSAYAAELSRVRGEFE